ncbi:MAG: hypothetical protein GY771_14760, partial [bacterium]|nr:hypothetical protein [bacterium]
MRAVTISLTIFISLVSIASAAEYDLDQVRARIAGMYNDILLALWENDTQGGDKDTTEFWTEYADITDDPELLAYLNREAESEADPIEKRRLELLYASLTSIYAENALLGIDREIEGRLDGAHVWINGLDESVLLSDYGRYFFAGDTDPEILQNMRVAKSNFYINTLNPLYEQRLQKEQVMAGDMGYASYTDFYFTTYDLDRAKAEGQA